MLVVISPAKRLDWSDAPGLRQTKPRMLEEANALARRMKRQSGPDLMALMDISKDLAALNRKRFTEFSDDPAAGDTRPAMRAFAGDTYQGLDAASLDEDAVRWADDHLRILSGLYGLLRPRDAIQPYRLEMGTRLATNRGKSLYDWWEDRIALHLNRDAESAGTRLLVNCASQEYFTAADRDALDLDVVTPVFLEDKPGGPKMVSFYAKKARGAMARFIVEHRLTDADQLHAFDLGGYAYQADLSEPGKPAFLRAD